MASAVETHDLKRHFGDVPALGGVSFSVPGGTLLGIIGADGAGKSTLLRILVTLIRADSGTAAVLGRSVETDYPSIRGLIGYMPQKFSLYGDLSVRENLLFFADIFGVAGAERRDRLDPLLSFSRLADFQNRRAADLSGGMKQKLALSCALVHTPQLLILDEPTTGVDPVSRREFWEILSDLRKQGITILVSTPYMDEATACDRLLILHKGELLRDGTPAALLAGYPLALYAVKNEKGSVGMPPARMPLPPGAVLLYPSAGELRIACRSNADPEQILVFVKERVPSAGYIEKTLPAIEDLLFQVLSEKEPA